MRRRRRRWRRADARPPALRLRLPLSLLRSLLGRRLFLRRAGRRRSRHPELRLDRRQPPAQPGRLLLGFEPAPSLLRAPRNSKSAQQLIQNTTADVTQRSSRAPLAVRSPRTLSQHTCSYRTPVPVQLKDVHSWYVGLVCPGERPHRLERQPVPPLLELEPA